MGSHRVGHDSSDLAATAATFSNLFLSQLNGGSNAYLIAVIKDK